MCGLVNTALIMCRGTRESAVHYGEEEEEDLHRYPGNKAVQMCQGSMYLAPATIQTR